MIYYYIGDCMKNKMVIVLVILGVLLVASGGALSIVNGFKGEQCHLLQKGAALLNLFWFLKYGLTG